MVKKNLDGMCGDNQDLRKRLYQLQIKNVTKETNFFVIVLIFLFI